ncbi:hypothetical protein KUTeg_009463 [Tegillarca granosa]|uniref:UNC93-like protein n=1 Tax=Tegillarca granosa TaxID=220873 RepID=A0ABQ9F909_TEGGR|nr:hypothetical protein KUTeg_009463 [Tegillarca granosa]
MWTAQGSYVTTIAMEYAPLVGENFESVLSKFFGIFCMAFQSTQIWGNLISSAILGTGVTGNSTNDNFTVPAYCGAKDCPFDQAPGNFSEAQQPENTADRILISLYLGFVGIGLLITVIFLKPLKSSASNEPVSLKRLLAATLRLLCTNLNMTLLVPFSFYTGLEQVVMYAEFTKSYVACELGIHWVGYTLISFGVLNTVGSPLSGVLGKYIGRPALFLIASLLNLGVLASLRLLTLTRNELIIFFALPGVWGLGDAIWQTQSGALVGSTFADQQEPAFSNLRMFQALGFTVGYLYSNFLCESIKLYIVAGVLLLSMLLVGIVEIRIRRSDVTSTQKALVI